MTVEQASSYRKIALMGEDYFLTPVF